MQIEAASTMGMNVHEPRHHNHALSVDNAARLRGGSPDLLDTLRREREVACRQVQCGINQPGAAQGASHGHLFANSLPGNCQLTLGWCKADTTGDAPARGRVVLDNRRGACHDTAYVVVYTSYRLYHLSSVASIPCRALSDRRVLRIGEAIMTC